MMKYTVHIISQVGEKVNIMNLHGSPAVTIFSFQADKWMWYQPRTGLSETGSFPFSITTLKIAINSHHCWLVVYSHQWIIPKNHQHHHINMIIHIYNPIFSYLSHYPSCVPSTPPFRSRFPKSWEYPLTLETMVTTGDPPFSYWCILRRVAGWGMGLLGWWHY